MAKLDPKQQERLAAALRDNLKRRKTQSREGETGLPLDKDAES